MSSDLVSCDEPHAAGSEIGSAEGYDGQADEALALGGIDSTGYALDRVRQALQFDYMVI